MRAWRYYGLLVLNLSCLFTESLPRYVRVNTLKTTREEVINHFKTENYVEIPSIGGDYER